MPKICEGGICGSETRSGNRFVHGHNGVLNKGKNRGIQDSPKKKTI